MPSDDELIAACRNGETDAWQRMVRRYEPLVFSVPLRYRLSRPEAEDVVQSTFIILMQSLNDLRPNSNLGAWLCTIARRRTWRVLRQNAREIHPDPDNDADWLQFAEALGAKDVEAFDYWDLADWLSRGLAQLPDQCRELLLAL
jgi:RNA polymerase sigma factor (sigma-70 family)